MSCSPDAKIKSTKKMHAVLIKGCIRLQSDADREATITM